MADPVGVDRLGTEPIGALLWEMSSQTTLSLLVYAIYSVTDTYFLSVGISALAAAGASIISPVLIALGGVATTVGSGGASLVSRALGARDHDRASRAVANTLVVFWVVALVITIFGAALIEPIVFLLGATDSVAPFAITYGRIIFLGALTSTGFSTIVRADGNIRYSTAMWIIPVSANILLCWVFIILLHLGVAGAALATVTGQAISATMSLYFFFLRPSRSYRIRAAHFKPDWPIMAEVVAIGFPSFIKGFSAGLVVVVTNNLLKAFGGDSALSVFAIASRIYSGLITPQTGIVQGMQPITGYNFGRARFDRVWRTISLSLGASIGYGVVVGALCLALPAALIGLLTTDPTIVTEGQVALRWMALAFPLGGISVLVAASFQSVGKAKEALLITLGGILFVKLPVLLLASRIYSLTGIWVSEAVSELVLCVIALGMLRRFQARQTARLAPASSV